MDYIMRGGHNTEKEYNSITHRCLQVLKRLMYCRRTDGDEFTLVPLF